MKDLAGYVSQAVKKSHLKNLLVMDFQGPDHDYSLLGRSLADDLRAALAADPTLNLVDRRKYIEFISREALLIPEANRPDPANWISSQVAAKSFVIGEYLLSGNDVILHVKIYDCPKPRNIQNLKATFSSTTEMPSLDRRTLAATGDDAVSADQKRSIVLSSARGYGIPECLHCPQPPYSKEAIERKAAGTVVLVAKIDESGHITDVIVAKGLFYGLNDMAVKYVKQWLMKPATAPDGKPATVQQLIEITFKLY